MPPDTGSRPLPDNPPLVSLVVMAYNQADIIADTIHGVLAQDYPNLEIILSDDGSSDNTFDVMERLVADYDGPHDVRLYRNTPNKGFVGHLNHIFTLCRGELIVYNAGDDISLPHRVTRLVDVAGQSDALLIHSEAYEIDAKGQRTGDINSRQHILDEMTLKEAAVSMALCTGATCAWRPEIMTRFGPIVEDPTFDDLIFCFRAMLLDRITFVAEPLMDYRVGVGISNYPDDASTPADRLAAGKQKFQKKFAVRIATLSQRSRDCRTAGNHALAEMLDREVDGNDYLVKLMRDPRFDRWSRFRSLQAFKRSIQMRNRLKLKMKKLARQVTPSPKMPSPPDTTGGGNPPRHGPQPPLPTTATERALMSSSSAVDPLVSMIVFGYNQADMIAPTIEGALAQDYPNLEIILSDNGSSDDTYGVMQHMAAAYDGPHTVRLNRNQPGLGFVGHINQAFKLCRGELIVYNPGDDISLPHRVSRLAREAAGSSALLIHSDAHEIGLDGARTGKILSQKDALDAMSTEDAALAMALGIGATSAWRPEIFTRFGPIVEQYTFDDLVFCFRAMLLDRMAHVAEPLMEYRVGLGLSELDNHAALPIADRAARHKALLRSLRVRLSTLRQRQRDCRVLGRQDLVDRIEEALGWTAYHVRLMERPNFDWLKKRWSRDAFVIARDRRIEVENMLTQYVEGVTPGLPPTPPER